jgi:IrrE N-terminal-like domain
VHLDEGRAAFTVNLRSSESSKGEDNDEREANLFAAELLMPAKFLREDLEGEELDLLENNFSSRPGEEIQCQSAGADVQANVPALHY